MAKSLDPQRTDIEAKRGHFRAYGTVELLLWEQEDFIVGVDTIPQGLSEAMRACTITDKRGNIVHRWDPYNLFHERQS